LVNFIIVIKAKKKKTFIISFRIFYSKGITRNMIAKNGIKSLYDGLTAALLRQGTYSTVRFAFYEITKKWILNNNNKSNKKDVSFYQKILIAGLGGGIGSLFGSPCDLVTVRMQNDLKLDANKRRNYKNVFNALYRIAKYEGLLQLYTGFHMATIRGVLVTIGRHFSII
jgi:solute carrier family 25 (mitochondrial dicarboxylate transporter), member 10